MQGRVHIARKAAPIASLPVCVTLRISASQNSALHVWLKRLAAGRPQSTTAFSLDDFMAGKSKKWYFWDCAPSEFPWSYSKGGEDAYILEGQFYVTYEGVHLVQSPCTVTHVP